VRCGEDFFSPSCAAVLERVRIGGEGRGGGSRGQRASEGLVERNGTGRGGVEALRRTEAERVRTGTARRTPSRSLYVGCRRSVDGVEVRLVYRLENSYSVHIDPG
jgi:hypothetical protein